MKRLKRGKSSFRQGSSKGVWKDETAPNREIILPRERREEVCI